MRQAQSVATLRLLGDRAPRPSSRKARSRRPPSEAELHQRELGRAWRCGARYASLRWRKKCPPRWCRYGNRPGHPEAAAEREIQAAFFRGYWAAARARYRLRAKQDALLYPLRAEARP